MHSYDVTALFTSMIAARGRLMEDDKLADRTKMSVEQVMTILEFCLNTTYFMYKGDYYQQTEGAAMGSPVSPIIANLYMEVFEEKALATAPHPPKLWIRYVDDTFVIIKSDDIPEFTAHINSLDTNIQFTAEPETDGKLPFLDSCAESRGEEGGIRTVVYRKPTHTDQYLQFTSNHHLSHKRSVVRSLQHRAKTIVIDPDDQKKELEYVSNVLTDNGYAKWMFTHENQTSQTN